MTDSQQAGAQRRLVDYFSPEARRLRRRRWITKYVFRIGLVLFLVFGVCYSMNINLFSKETYMHKNRYPVQEMKGVLPKNEHAAREALRGMLAYELRAILSKTGQKYFDVGWGHSTDFEHREIGMEASMSLCAGNNYNREQIAEIDRKVYAALDELGWRKDGLHFYKDYYMLTVDGYPGPYAEYMLVAPYVLDRYAVPLTVEEWDVPEMHEFRHPDAPVPEPLPTNGGWDEQGYAQRGVNPAYKPPILQYTYPPGPLVNTLLTKQPKPSSPSPQSFTTTTTHPKIWR